MAAEGKYEHQMTLAELCQAVEEGRVPYTIGEGHYLVRAADLHRMLRLGRACLALPALPELPEIPAELLDCPDMGRLNFGA